MKIIAALSPDQVYDQAVYYDNCGADELYYYDADSFEEGREEDIKTIREIYQNADIPANVFAKVKRFEDVKKMIYAGAKRVIVRTDSDEEIVLKAVKEASERFGAERLFLYMEEDDPGRALVRAQRAPEEGFGGIVLGGDCSSVSYARCADYLKASQELPVWVMINSADPSVISDVLKMTMPAGAVICSGKAVDMMALKQALISERIPVKTLTSSLDFDEFKLNSDGMIPVVTQDYKTGEVLMVAYMTKESYEKTIETGKMTYYSRSRQELWTKGDTSGHYQYVKCLSIDCDKDTILAKVAQVGAACHTGNRSCFYTDLLRKEYDDRNPLAVFEEVYATILDRKEHPKEGSYTNYLFDKGVDKILKKLGEEATEIVIAAKNPDSDELKYEICDFLYHMMVLMADRDVNWKEITQELAQRH